MRLLVYTLIALSFFVGCSNTWQGAKKDTNNVYEWSKSKVNDGASWVEEKTR